MFAMGNIMHADTALVQRAQANDRAAFNEIVLRYKSKVYNYIFRMGFLDGREGLILHINHSVYIHWKFIKAWRIGVGKE